MGSSAKKKKEKKKDFQKTKLKVGKPNVKAANFTDTSFLAKSISLKKQTLSIETPDSSAQFFHHLALLKSKSDVQRSESLAYLTKAVGSRSPDAVLPEPVATLLPKLQPLILDGSNAVRQQLLRLLECMPTEEVAARPTQMLLYTHAAMTHMSADIRSFSMDVLAWLLRAAGREVVDSPGGWYKTLQCFSGLLGWVRQGGVNGWSSTGPSSAAPRSSTKTTARALNTLAMFINIGLAAPSRKILSEAASTMLTYFPTCQLKQHGLPIRANAFQHLHIFGDQVDDEVQALDERVARQKVFATHFAASFRSGAEGVKSEGGELGRASATLGKAIADGMRDSEDWTWV